MGNSRSWVSDNGSAWSVANNLFNISVTYTDNGSVGTFQPNDLAFTNNEFLAVGGVDGYEARPIAVRSSDGVNWTFAGMIDNFSNQPAEAVAFGMVDSQVVDNWTSDNLWAWSVIV